MINFDNIYIEIYVIVIILAIVFFFLSKIHTNILIIIVIIILLSYAIFFYLQKISEDKDSSTQNKEKTIDDDIKDREEVSENIFYIDKFPKQCKYLKENKKLMDIVLNIRFIRKFSKSKFSDIILNMNKLMKIYIYILAERYDAVHFIPLFTDIRDNIIEMMYSLIMIVPERMKHVYGLDPYHEIDKSINDFTILSDEMLGTLEKYARIYLKEIYIPDTKYKAYNIAHISFFP